MDAAAAPAQKRTPANDAVIKVWSMCQNIVGSPIEFVPDASLADLGIDELGLAELLFQIGQEFGEGLVSVEDVIAMPTIQEIASLLPPPGKGAKLADPNTASGLVRHDSRANSGVSLKEGLTTQEAACARPALSYYENLAVGVGGGCFETAALMPVLTVKFCAQEGRALPKLPHSLGTIAPWYRGVTVLAGSVAPLTGLQMCFNGLFEGVLTGGSRAATSPEVIFSALGAGAVSALLYGPVEMTTIHQQKTGLSPLGTISHLTRTYGTACLWRGVVPTAWREAIYTAGYLGLAPLICAKLMRQKGWEESFFASAVLSSCVAGVIANVATHPIDTAKTVIQADVTGAKYRGMLQTLPELYRTNGMARLYSGGLARTIRTCGAFFIVSTIREKCIQFKATDNKPRGK